ncbi:MAG: hypothetical protein JWL77_7135 [Chthonomonadaceae bacterium]|nr:hypothetical protein [Chthonomonadaceae bacterium]
MSFTENDRKLRTRIGKTFHGGDDRDGMAFNQTIAGALRADFGSAPSVVKHVARLTGANDRTVRNWFEGNNGPSGENLARLMQHSDAVLEAVLAISHRSRIARGIAILSLRDKLVAAVAAIDAMEVTPRDHPSPNPPGA